MSDDPKPPASLPPKTTAEQDITTAGQRRVNLIWETMQAIIAAAVVGTALYTSCRLALVILIPAATESQRGVAATAFMLISNLVSLIIGFYFGRTNHTKIGGIGDHEVGR